MPAPLTSCSAPYSEKLPTAQNLKIETAANTDVHAARRYKRSGNPRAKVAPRFIGLGKGVCRCKRHKKQKTSANPNFDAQDDCRFEKLGRRGA